MTTEITSAMARGKGQALASRFALLRAASCDACCSGFVERRREPAVVAALSLAEGSEGEGWCERGVDRLQSSMAGAGSVGRIRFGGFASGSVVGRAVHWHRSPHRSRRSHPSVGRRSLEPNTRMKLLLIHTLFTRPNPAGPNSVGARVRTRSRSMRQLGVFFGGPIRYPVGDRRHAGASGSLP